MNCTGSCSSMKKVFVLSALFLSILGGPARPAAAAETREPVYVGSDACQACHPEEYESFITYAKKAKSFTSIERLQRNLTPEEVKRCYACHTTGYGQPGGFISLEETPYLKNSGCEVCHGPGEKHIRDQSAASIKGHLTKKDCEVCHISERVQAFRYKPLIHGGAH
jgi:hypothetical protein